MGIYSLAFAGLFPFGSLLTGFLTHSYGVGAALWLAHMSEAPPSFMPHLRFLCVADGEKAKEKMGFQPAFTTREAVLDFTSAQRLRDVKLLQETPA